MTPTTKPAEQVPCVEDPKDTCCDCGTCGCGYQPRTRTIKAKPPKRLRPAKRHPATQPRKGWTREDKR